MSFFGARPAASLEPKDIEVPNLPTDSTSSLSFSPTADILAVASWSNEVRLYEVNSQGQAVGKAAYSHEGPVLGVQWSKVRCACCDPLGGSRDSKLMVVETLSPCVMFVAPCTGRDKVYFGRRRQGRTDV